MKLQVALLTIAGCALSAQAASDPIEVPEFNVEDHLEEAKKVFDNFCDSDPEAYSFEEFKATVGGEEDRLLALTFKRDDANKDQRVTFDEFKRWFTRGNLFLQLDGAVDGTRDGRISLEEFMIEWHGMPDSIFDADDADGDGFVTFEEFTGPKGANAPRVNVFANLDSDRSGDITLEEFQVEWHTVDESVFHDEDVDSDNVLTWSEFQGPKGSSLDEALQAEVRLPPGSEGESINLFAALDTDLDARLSESEFFVEWHKQATKEIFESEDTDKNGFLEWTEFGGPKGTVDPTETLKRNIFVALDADLNLVISYEEFMASKQSFAEDERQALFESDDKDHSGDISWEEFSGPKGDQPPNYDVFGQLDADADGLISREEFLVENNNLGNEEQFVLEDKNGDGAISWDEFGGPKLPTGPKKDQPQKEL